MGYYLGKIYILDHFSCKESLIWTLSRNDTLLSVIFLIVWPWILTITHVPHRCTPFSKNLYLTCIPFGNFCTPFGTWWDDSPATWVWRIQKNIYNVKEIGISFSSDCVLKTKEPIIQDIFLHTISRITLATSLNIKISFLSLSTLL